MHTKKSVFKKYTGSKVVLIETLMKSLIYKHFSKMCAKVKS